MDQVLSLDEVAERLGVHRRTVERLIAVNEGPPLVRLTARRIGVMASDAQAWLDTRRTAPTHPTIDNPPPRRRGRPRKAA